MVHTVNETKANWRKRWIPKPLKIKLKTLAEEARIIRKEEQKMRGHIWGPKAEKYHRHRIDVVRTEARATHLAYGFLRNRTYGQVESGSHKTVPYERVAKLVSRYGGLQYRDVTAETIKAWVKASMPGGDAAPPIYSTLAS